MAATAGTDATRACGNSTAKGSGAGGTGAGDTGTGDRGAGALGKSVIGPDGTGLSALNFVNMIES